MRHVAAAAPLTTPRIGDDVDALALVHHVRRTRGRAFVQAWTPWGLVQIVVEGEPPATVRPGATVSVRGTVVGAALREPTLAWRDREVAATELVAVWTPPTPLPFDLSKPTLQVGADVLYEQRVLTLRHPRVRAVFRVSDALVRGFRAALGARGFVEIHSPKLVAQGAEGGADVFEVPYFGQRAWLAQSPQLYKELATAAFLRVFEVGPVFRAEPHATRRHLAEYVSLDAELGPIASMDEVMAVLTAAVAEMFAEVRRTCAPEVELLGLQLPDVTSIPTVSFAEWKARTGDAEPDLSPAEEQALCDEVRAETGSELVFVTGYPSSKRPFYVLDDPERPGSTHSFDLLFRGTEIVSGGQRIHDPAQLAAKLRARGQDPADFAFFLRGHEHGLPPHGGFGLGLERLAALLCGLDNVREASLFPRDRHRLAP